MIFPECFHGPLKMRWRATCDPRAANCPPLLYMIELKVYNIFRQHVAATYYNHVSPQTLDIIQFHSDLTLLSPTFEIKCCMLQNQANRLLSWANLTKYKATYNIFRGSRFVPTGILLRCCGKHYTLR